MRFLQKSKDMMLALFIPLSLLVSWEVATRLELVPNQLLIPPKQLALTFLDLLKSGELTEHLKISLFRVLAGFLSGASVGFVLGVAMGLSKTIERYIGPIFNAVRQVPVLGWMPFLMLWFGIGEGFKIIFISIGALYPMTINTYEGIKSVSKEYLEVARVFEFNKYKLLTKVALPSALPSVLTGLRLSLSTSWMMIVGAELVAASEGVGYMMTMGRQLFQIDIVMVGVIVIGIAGFIMNESVKLLETYFLRWRKSYNA